MSWICEYCSTSNKNSSRKCFVCGSTKTTVCKKDGFHKKKLNIGKKIKPFFSKVFKIKKLSYRFGKTLMKIAALIIIGLAIYFIVDYFNLLGERVFIQDIYSNEEVYVESIDFIDNVVSKEKDECIKVCCIKFNITDEKLHFGDSIRFDVLSGNIKKELLDPADYSIAENFSNLNIVREGEIQKKVPAYLLFELEPIDSKLKIHLTINDFIPFINQNFESNFYISVLNENSVDSDMIEEDEMYIEILDDEEEEQLAKLEDPINKGSCFSLPSNIESTTVLEGYPVEHLVDNNLSTTWAEGRENYGKGDEILFTFESGAKFDTFSMINGYAKSEELYLRNARIKRIEIQVGLANGEVIIDEAFSYKDDCMEFQSYKFDNKGQEVEFVKMIIRSIYQGTRYRDTCISEVQFVNSEIATEINLDHSDTDYILPDSDKRYITESDLDVLTKEEVKIARNEIYARYGWCFKSEFLQDYFRNKEWYSEDVNCNIDNLPDFNNFESTNRRFISDYEEKMGWDY